MPNCPLPKDSQPIMVECEHYYWWSVACDMSRTPLNMRTMKTSVPPKRRGSHILTIDSLSDQVTYRRCDQTDFEVLIQTSASSRPSYGL